MRYIILASFVLFTFLRCELKNVDSGLNPYDPESPGYEAPSFTFTSGPDNGAVVSSDSVTYSWTGNQPDILYSYRLKEAKNTEWNDWISLNNVTTLMLGPLDEQEYDFEMKATYPGVGAAEGDPKARTFTIDAVAGPSLLFYPKKQELSNNQTFTIDIIAEEVTDLTMADFTVIFTKNLLQIVNTVKKGGIVADENNMLLLTKPDTETEANSNGELSISVGLLNQSKGYSGTAVLCSITFKAIASGNAGLSIASEAQYRNYNNQQIVINVSGKAWVAIK